MAIHNDKRGNTVSTAETDKIVEATAVQSRQGLLGRPVLMVLLGGLVLGVVAWRLPGSMAKPSTTMPPLPNSRRPTPRQSSTPLTRLSSTIRLPRLKKNCNQPPPTRTQRRSPVRGATRGQSCLPAPKKPSNIQNGVLHERSV